MLLVISVEDLKPQADLRALMAEAGNHAMAWWNTHGRSSPDQKIDPPTLVVLNKIDLLGQASTQQTHHVLEATWPVIAVSAKEAQGLEALMQAVLKQLVDEGQSSEPVWARLRHVKALERAMGHLALAQDHWTTSTGQADLMAEELRLAQQALAEIVGTWSDEDLLGAIFGRFCIGK